MALSPEQLHALNVGQTLYRPIGRAVSYARFDGWSVAVFAILTGGCGITSPTTLILGVGMGAVAWYELRQASRVASADRSAPKRLALNLLALSALLVGYAVVRLFQGIDAGELAMIRGQLAAADPAMADMVESMATLISRLVYGTLIVVSICLQGGTALFYHSRRKAVEAYLRGTPEWVRTINRA